MFDPLQVWFNDLLSQIDRSQDKMLNIINYVLCIMSIHYTELSSCIH